eukprot:gene460-581_t
MSNSVINCGDSSTSSDGIIPLKRGAVHRDVKVCNKCRDPTVKTIIFYRSTESLSKCRENKKDSSRLVVGLSGGTSSLVMLELLSQCISSPKSRMFLDLYCVHIDDSILYKDNPEKANIVEFLKKVTTSYGFKFYSVPIENVFGGSGSDEKNIEMKRKLLFDNLNSLQSTTAKEDLIEFYINQLINETANNLNCVKIVLGSSSNRIAMKLLSSTSKGRGFVVPNETALVTNQSKNGIKIYQPMREFLLKEIYIYYRHKRLMEVPSILLMLKPKYSLNTLCEDFINQLQDISSQTIHTLLRSVDKLISPSDDNSIQFTCSLCSCLLTKDEIKNLENSFETKKGNNSDKSSSSSCCSTNNQSTSSCCNTDNNNNNNNNNGCCGGSNGNQNSLKQNSNNLKETLCYSCKILLLRDSKSNNQDTFILPPFLLDNSKTLLTTCQLKNEIKEFLLDDDDDDDEDDDN